MTPFEFHEAMPVRPDPLSSPLSRYAGSLTTLVGPCLFGIRTNFSYAQRKEAKSFVQGERPGASLVLGGNFGDNPGAGEAGVTSHTSMRLRKFPARTGTVPLRKGPDLIRNWLAGHCSIVLRKGRKAFSPCVCAHLSTAFIEALQLHPLGGRHFLPSFSQKPRLKSGEPCPERAHKVIETCRSGCNLFVATHTKAKST